MSEKKVILEVKNLTKYFPVMDNGKKKVVKAVDNVSLELFEEETLGLVGESGCGKSTLGRAILRLHEPTSGQVIFEGEDVLAKNRKQMKKLRTKMQFIFQDPYSSLNPRMNIFDILQEPLLAHKYFKKGDAAKQKVLDQMEACGLPSYYCYRFPHQFSGGQRQRIGIARSLVLDPSFVICDEPVSALDVSIQSQILNMMQDIRKEKKMSYIFISHDMAVVRYISDRIGVMYLGSIVELAEKNEIFDNPMHPYTRTLLSAIPKADPDEKMEMGMIQGEIPSNVDLPKGCKFHPRCPYATDRCKSDVPEYREMKPGHFVQCHFAGELDKAKTTTTEAGEA